MKKIIYSFIFTLIAHFSYAQFIPQEINYQAVARDASGAVLANETYAATVSVYSGPGGGTLVYSEDHNAATNEFGLFSFKIGLGANPSSTFSNIDWGSEEHWIQVTFNGDDLGVQKLRSVPYAMVSASANGLIGTPIDLTNAPVNGDVLVFNAGQWQVQSGLAGSNSIIQNGGTSVTCPNGGTILEFGTDTNGDLTLTGVEIQGSIDICNGVDGTNGNDGNDILVQNTVEPTGANCANGGTFVEYGIDADVSGTLTAAEIQGSYYVCNGADGTSLPVGASAGDVLKWDGSAWIAATDSVVDNDNDPVNEIQDISFNVTGDSLLISDGIGLQFTTSVPSIGDVIRWDGTNWIAGSETTSTLSNNGDGSFTYTDETGTTVSFDTTSAAAPGLWTDAGTETYLSSNDLVGIGTTLPTNKLFVESGDAGHAVGIANSNAAGSSSIAFRDNSGTEQFFIGYGNTGYSSPFNGVGYLNSATDFVFGISNGERMRLNTAGNLGIGTSTPSQRLDVNGVARMDSIIISNGANAGYVLTSDATGHAQWLPLSGSSAFATTGNVTSNSPGDLVNDDFVFGSNSLDWGGTTPDQYRMFYDKSKSAFRAGRSGNTTWNEANLGIGSVAFGFATTASGSYSFATGNNTIASAQYAFAHGQNTTASGNWSTAIGSGNTATNAFATSMGNGNDAIGVSSLVGGQDNTAESYAQVTFGSFSTNVAGNANAYVATNRLFVLGNGASGIARSDAFTVLKNGNTQINGHLSIDADNVGGANGYTLPGQDGLANYVMQTDGSGAVTWVNPSALGGGNGWDLSGNAGISASDFIGTNDASDLRVKTNNNTAVFIDGASQYVGIGTTNPSSVFHVNTENDANRIVSESNSSNAADHAGELILARSRLSSGAKDAIQSGDRIGQISFSGYGLGNYTDAGKIEVAATGLFSSMGGPSEMKFYTSDVSGNNTEAMIIDDNQRVGIGTAAPAAQLDINGDIRINDGTQAIGYVLTVANATGLALWQAPSVGSRIQDGGNDTYVETGVSNFIDFSLNNNLNFRMEGNRIGFLNSNNSVYIGQASGGNMTAGFNTMVGYQSGLANTTGAQNTLYGYRSGVSNTIGSINTAFGTSTLNANVTGWYNTAIGHNALFNSTGSQNTAIGHGTLFEVTTGVNNVALGHSAGPTNINASLSNRLYIDNSQTNTPLIGGNFATDEVNINGNLTLPSDNERLERESDAGTDLLPYAYGTVNAGAVVQSASSTNNFTVTSNVAGVYVLDFSGTRTFSVNGEATFTVSAISNGSNANFCSYRVLGTDLIEVRVHDATNGGFLISGGFSFNLMLK